MPGGILALNLTGMVGCFYYFFCEPLWAPLGIRSRVMAACEKHSEKTLKEFSDDPYWIKAVINAYTATYNEAESGN